MNKVKRECRLEIAAEQTIVGKADGKAGPTVWKPDLCPLRKGTGSLRMEQLEIL